MAFNLGLVTGAIELRDKFVSVLDNAEQRITGFSNRVEAETKRTKSLSDGLDLIGGAATKSGLALTAGLTAPIALVGGLVAKLGIDAVESRNLMEVSFGSMINEADSWANALSKDLGLNRFEMEKTAGTMFNMVSSMGLARPAAFEVSTGIVKLAADMASFRNISIEDALTKLKAGLVGETEPLKAIGILVDENTVKAYAYKNGIAAQGTELSAQQKVLARYGAIMQQTSNDQGDLARTMESPANQLRIMRSRIEEAATSLGVSLIPMISSAINIVSKVVPYIQSFVEWFTKLPAPVQLGTVALAGIVAAAGPIVLIFGQIVSATSALLPLMAEGVTVTGLMTTALTALGSAVAVVAVAYASWEVGKKIGEWTGATDAIERWTAELLGATEAEVRATQAARHSAETHQDQKTVVDQVKVAQEAMNNALAEEAKRQADAAAATTLASTAQKLAETRAKEHAKALFEVNEKIASAYVMNNKLTDSQIAQAESYKTLGLSIADIALKMGIAETAVQHYFDVTKKSQDVTKELWKAHYDAIAADSQLASETQRDAIQRWFDHEVSLLDKSDKNYQDHYNALAATAQDKIGAINTAWEDAKKESIEAAQEQLKIEQEVYEKMITGGKTFSREVLDEHLKKIQDLKDKLHGMGKAGKDAFDTMTEAAKNNTTAMIKAAEEADKARAANRAMGGSFEVTRENFEAESRGMGYDPGQIEQLLKKGYSFQQAILWAKHPDWPPPEHPGPRVQGFQYGGMVAKVGEHGAERVALPWGSIVMPNKNDMPGGGSGSSEGGIHIDELHMHVNGTGEQVHRDFKRRLMRDVKIRKQVGPSM